MTLAYQDDLFEQEDDNPEASLNRKQTADAFKKKLDEEQKDLLAQHDKL